MEKAPNNIDRRKKPMGLNVPDWVDTHKLELAAYAAVGSTAVIAGIGKAEQAHAWEPTITNDCDGVSINPDYQGHTGNITSGKDFYAWTEPTERERLHTSVEVEWKDAEGKVIDSGTYQVDQEEPAWCAATATPTSTPTRRPSKTPTVTSSPTETRTPMSTPTNTPEPTATQTTTATATETQVPTPTRTPTPEATVTPTPTSEIHISTITVVPTLTETPQPPLVTVTPTTTPTETPAPIETPTPEATVTPTATPETHILTITVMPTRTETPTPAEDAWYPSFDLGIDGECIDKAIELDIWMSSQAGRRPKDKPVEHRDGVKVLVPKDAYATPPVEQSGVLELETENSINNDYWTYNVKGGLDRNEHDNPVFPLPVDKDQSVTFLIVEQPETEGQVNKIDNNAVTVHGACEVDVEVTPKSLGGQTAVSSHAPEAQQVTFDNSLAALAMTGVFIVSRAADLYKAKFAKRT